MARTIQQRFAEHPADIGHDFGGAGGMQSMAAEIYPQARNLETTRVASNRGFALNGGHIKTSPARQLPCPS
jgi:hypothetical protein